MARFTAENRGLFGDGTIYTEMMATWFHQDGSVSTSPASGIPANVSLGTGQSDSLYSIGDNVYGVRAFIRTDRHGPYERTVAVPGILSSFTWVLGPNSLLITESQEPILKPVDDCGIEKKSESPIAARSSQTGMLLPTDTNVTREVRFGRSRFKLLQGAITIHSINHMVSETADTITSPGLIKFMPYWTGIHSQETSLGVDFTCASVCFDVDFPFPGRIYYKWIDVTYRYRAGSVNEIRHAYLDLEGFLVQ